MPLRTRLLLIIGVVVILVGGVILLAKYRPTNKPADEKTPADTSSFQPNVQIIPGTQSTAVPPGTPSKPMSTLEAEQNGVRQLAKVFVERYNTFSSENEYQNITDVKELVTASLWSRISARLKTPAAPAATFSAVTTVVVNAVLDDWKTTTASITLKSKKENETGATKNETYQTTVVTMVKLNGVWLVDSFKNQ